MSSSPACTPVLITSGLPYFACAAMKSLSVAPQLAILNRSTWGATTAMSSGRSTVQRNSSPAAVQAARISGIQSRGHATTRNGSALSRCMRAAAFSGEEVHAVSGYPTPMQECNLAVLRVARWGDGVTQTVPLYDGFSDHTRNTITGPIAVAAGARVLEVHFTLTETNPKNPDRVVSLMPWELQAYIGGARLAYQALGDGIKRVMPSEAQNVRHRYV